MGAGCIAFNATFCYEIPYFNARPIRKSGTGMRVEDFTITERFTRIGRYSELMVPQRGSIGTMSDFPGNACNKARPNRARNIYAGMPPA